MLFINHDLLTTNRFNNNEIFSVLWWVKLVFRLIAENEYEFITEFSFSIMSTITENEISLIIVIKRKV